MRTQAKQAETTWSRLACSDQADAGDAVLVAELNGARIVLVRIGETLSVATDGPICVTLGAGSSERSQAAAAAMAALDVSSQP
jgi:hypothetical protein